MSRTPRQQRQRPPESSRAASPQPSPQPSAAPDGWDAIAASLLDAMQQRLGAMHDSWVHAEGRRLRDLLDAANSAPDTAQRLALLQQLAALDPELLEGEVEIAALVRRAEALIDRCRAGDKRTASGSKSRARDHRSGRA